MNQHYRRLAKGKTGSQRAVFVDGVRTPFAKSFGVFEKCDALSLYSKAIDGLVHKLNLDPNEVDEVICGSVLPQTKNMNIARDAVMVLGYPQTIQAYGLNRACASSLQAVSNAVQTIRSGEPFFILAGGVEVLSDVTIPYSKKARQFLISMQKARSFSERVTALKQFSIYDWIPQSPGLTEPLTGFTMGEHAEMMGKINEISRDAQDALACASHQKAALAQEKGVFTEEIVPVWPQEKYQLVKEDNIVRSDTNLESLAKLRPVFDKKQGRITAGNASPLTDGAAASLIADENRALELGLKPKSTIVDFVYVGVEATPQLLLGPAIAIPALLKRNDLTVDDIDLFEVHEAFAAQVLSCLKCMESKDFMMKHFGDSKPFGKIDPAKLNVNGGAIAIGHPFGATGSRMLTTLSNELNRSAKRYGVIAICAAGGIAGAMLIERYGK